MCLLILLLCLPATAHAATFFKTPPNGAATVSTDVNDDLYVSGSNVDISSNINGDLLAAGGSVNFNGNTAQSLFITAGNIITSGTVTNDLRAAGGNLSIASSTGGDVLVFGGVVSMPGGSIGRDLIASAGNIVVNSPVEGKVLISGGDVTLNAPIKGSAQIQADKLRFGPKAVIDGNLSYRAPQKAVFEKGSVIKGKTTFQKAVKTTAGGLIAALVFFLVRTAGLLLLALVLVNLLPVKSKEIVNLRSYWAHFGLGFAVLASTPIAIILIFITVIGWPFALILTALYFIFLLAASAYAGVIVGSLFSRFVLKVPDYDATWLEAVIGVLILSVIGAIPYIGWIFWLIFLILALGKYAAFDFNLAKRMIGKEV